MKIERINSGSIHTYRPGGLPVAYSDGVSVSGAQRLVFIAGQVGMDRKGAMVSDDVGEQARQALLNVKAVVEEAGGTMDNVVKITTFLKSREFVERYLQVRSEFFRPDALPASTAVVVDFVNPEFLIEIEGIAILAD